MAANAVHTLLPVRCQGRGVAGAVEGEMEVGVGFIAPWHISLHLLESCLLRQGQSQFGRCHSALTAWKLGHNISKRAEGLAERTRATVQTHVPACSALVALLGHVEAFLPSGVVTQVCCIRHHRGSS